jgi:hypothetical protein
MPRLPDESILLLLLLLSPPMTAPLPSHKRPFDSLQPVDYAQALKPLVRNAPLVPSLSVFSADMGECNFAFWVGAYNAATQRVDTQAWIHTSLLGDTPGAVQAYMVERVLSNSAAARATDYMIEQQKPINHATKMAENISAYGLQCALNGALCAATRLRAANERRVFVRSPQHKFHVLGVECPKSKPQRKALAKRLAFNYLSRYESPQSPAWRIWNASQHKQDDLADCLVSGLTYLIELDARAPQPLLEPVKQALLTAPPRPKTLLEMAAAAAVPNKNKKNSKKKKLFH